MSAFFKDGVNEGSAGAGGFPAYEVIQDAADGTPHPTRDLTGDSPQGDQINSFMKELVSMRNDVQNIRAATHIGFQDIEQHVRQQFDEFRSCPEKADGAVRQSEPDLQSVCDQRLESFQEEIRTHTLETDRRLAAFQEDTKQEARLRELSATQFAQQLLELTEAIEKQAAERPSDNARGASLELLSGSLGSDSTERAKEMASMAHQLKDLRLCLEAEVGARSAATERLHREVHDFRSALDAEKAERASGTKASKESLHDMGQALQVRMLQVEGSLQDVRTLREEVLSRKEVDDKIQMLLGREGQQRGASSLEVEVLREGLNSLEAQAKKHMTWVENQAEKHATRQDVLEASVVQEAKAAAKARAVLDEELRHNVQDELSRQAKFFSGELKGLLASAHSSWVEESRKLWAALGQQGREREEPATPTAAAGELRSGNSVSHAPKKDAADPSANTPAAPFPSASGPQPYPSSPGKSDRATMPGMASLSVDPGSGNRVAVPPEAGTGLMGARSATAVGFKTLTGLPTQQQQQQQQQQQWLPTAGPPTSMSGATSPRQAAVSQPTPGGNVGMRSAPFSSSSSSVVGQNTNPLAGSARQPPSMASGNGLRQVTPAREREDAMRATYMVRPHVPGAGDGSGMATSSRPARSGFPPGGGSLSAPNAGMSKGPESGSSASMAYAAGAAKSGSIGGFSTPAGPGMSITSESGSPMPKSLPFAGKSGLSSGFATPTLASRGSDPRSAAAKAYPGSSAVLGTPGPGAGRTI